ncbi:hypothetical protein ACX80L_12560 [Arthrobacter sp. MDT1-48-3]
MAALLLTACAGTTEPAGSESQSTSQAPADAATPAPSATSEGSAGEGPAITKSFVAPSKVDVTSKAAVIEVRVQLADADGVEDAANVELSNEEFGESVSGTFARTAGTPADSAWKADVEIPSGAAAGTWDVMVTDLKDTLGNETTGGSLTIGSIEVTSAESK